LANITPSGIISSTPNGANFDYTITLTNSNSSNAGIGTFWYAWVPGQDYLATNPVSVTPPTGWTDNITNMGAGDGYAIQYLANSSAYYVQPGSSLNFLFTSADTPASVEGDSKFYPGTPVGTSFVYPTGPFSDSGHQFVVKALSSIAVTPVNPSVPKGETEQFDAMGTFSDGTKQDLTNEVTWTSATKSVATISNAAGTQGLATAAGAGTSTISASLDGVSGSTVMTVTAAALKSIAVTPANTSLPTGEAEQFTATGTFSDNSTENLTKQVTWASSDTTWATIDSTGLATAVSPGAVTISATLDGITGSTALTVTAAVLQSIAVTPANRSLPAGETEQFAAIGTYSDKSTQTLTNQVTWASSDTAWATINSTGLATAVSPGAVTISATLDGITGSTALTVTAAVLQSIAVTPANPSVAAGMTEQFTAVGTYSDKSTQTLTTQVTWASATKSVATISNASGSQGLATAVSAGTSTISAELNGITGSTVLTVSAATLQSIAVTPANTSLPTGETEQFTATGTFSDNSTEDLTKQVTWASSDTTWATINSTGLATAVSPGAVTISATLDGITGSTALTVTAAVLQSIAVTPANPSVAAGLTEQFKAVGTYSDKSTQTLTTQVTWASATKSVATISNASGSQGLATAVAAGTSTISAALDGISGSTVLTVTASRPPTLSPVAVKANSMGGYYQYGPWTVEPGGYLGTVSVANPKTASSASARWMLTVPAGTYDFWASWANAASDATNTGYSIYDGFKKLGTVSENQQLAPAAGQYGGVDWANLGTFTVSNGRVTVALSASGANGDIVANGIILTSPPPAAAAIQTTSDSGASTTSASGPIETAVPTTTSGQDQVVAALTTAPTTATVQVSSPPVPTAPVNPNPTTIAISSPTSITINYAADSATGQAGRSSAHWKTTKLTDHALRRVKAKHQLQVRESLIKRLARMHVMTAKQSVNHRPGR
jgi:uncharacterized protein YjdB